jgi:protein-S-isoprenylcysteine O-methyltransferase Ste14
VAAAVLAGGSAWMMLASKRALGRQWAYQARLVEGHRLVQRGPYALVRHPIYSALFGMALATGLVHSRWTALPPFVLIFAAGTAVRVRGEEGLLKEAFGREFEDYARRVPAFIPAVRRMPE